MPNVKKRLRSAGTAKKQQATEAPAGATEDHPTPAEIEQEEHEFVQVARKNWLKTSKRATKVKVKNDVLKQGIWDSLERDGFPYKALLLLESLQTLER
jgi:intron-binding protein aquarius